MDPITRRRFLWLVAGAAGLGGWAVWQRAGEDLAQPAASASPVGSPPPSTSLATTTSSRPETTSTPAQTTTSTVPPPVALEVIERQAWGARAATGTFDPHTIEHLTIHHTAVALTDGRRAPDRLRGHQAYHQGQGWADLAYHFAIDRAGHVYEARPFTAPGDTFTNYDPAGHFLPVLEGDYNSQQPTDEQLDSLVLLLAWAAAEFGLDPDTIGGHRDYAATTCPGDNLYAMLADGSIHERVRARLTAGGARLVYLRGDAGLERIAEIET